MRAGVHGSQSNNKTAHGVPTIAVTSIRFVWGATDETVNSGGTLSVEPRVGEMVEMTIGLTGGNGRGGAGHVMVRAEFDMIHVEFGSIGGGMIGAWDAAGEVTINQDACASGGVATSPLPHQFQAAMADTGTLRVVANEITVTDPNTGMSGTGPASNANFTVEVVSS